LLRRQRLELLASYGEKRWPFIMTSTPEEF